MVVAGIKLSNPDEQLFAPVFPLLYVVTSLDVPQTSEFRSDDCVPPVVAFRSSAAQSLLSACQVDLCRTTKHTVQVE